MSVTASRISPSRWTICERMRVRKSRAAHASVPPRTASAKPMTSQDAQRERVPGCSMGAKEFIGQLSILIQMCWDCKMLPAFD